MKIIGIDPGLSGAIAILENNKVLNIFEIPVMSEGKKNKRQLNSAQLVNIIKNNIIESEETVSYTHLRAHETTSDLVCRLLLEKNFFNDTATTDIYTVTLVGSVRCV